RPRWLNQTMLLGVRIRAAALAARCDSNRFREIRSCHVGVFRCLLVPGHEVILGLRNRSATLRGLRSVKDSPAAITVGCVPRAFRHLARSLYALSDVAIPHLGRAT